MSSGNGLLNSTHALPLLNRPVPDDVSDSVLTKDELAVKERLDEYLKILKRHGRVPHRARLGASRTEFSLLGIAIDIFEADLEFQKMKKKGELGK